MRKQFLLLALACLGMSSLKAETVELLSFGDFNQWVTRNIKESAIIGGKEKKVYEIAPTATLNGDDAYTNMGGSPWATSNVLAKVAGVIPTVTATVSAPSL